jgi:hypothetical protein
MPIDSALLFQAVFPFRGIILLTGIIAAPTALMAGPEGDFIAMNPDVWNESQPGPDSCHQQVFI